MALVVSPLGSLNAFEVITHQALTRCAITGECNSSGEVRSENLHSFIEDAKLTSHDIDYNYFSEKFQGYDKTYFEYASNGTGFETWKTDDHTNQPA